MFYKFFLIFCIFIPFQFALNPTTGVDLAVLRVIIPAFFLVFLIILFKEKNFSFLKNKVVCCLLLFIVLASVSLVFSHNLSWSFRKLAFILSFVPLFFVSLYFFIQPKNWRPAIIALIAGGSLISFLAIIQFVSQFIFGIDPVYNFLAYHITPFFLGNSFSQAVLAYPSWLVNSEGVTYMRAVANFPDPHMLAYYLGMLAPWAIVLWSTSKNHKLLFFAAFLLLIIADIMTFTRGSYIALIASSFVVLPIVSRKNAGKLLFGVFVFIILLITMPHGPVIGRFASSFDTQEGSNQARLSNWEQAAAIIASHPLGVGIGNYSLSVKPAAAYREPIYAHNLYLDIGAELGIPALFVFVLTLFFAFKGFWRVAKKNDFFVAGIASLTIFSVHSLVENPLYSVHVLPLLLILTALGATLTSYEKNNLS